MKQKTLYKENLEERYFSIFPNFCNVWLNSTELDSHRSFCIQPNAIF